MIRFHVVSDQLPRKPHTQYYEVRDALTGESKGQYYRADYAANLCNKLNVAWVREVLAKRRAANLYGV